MTDITVNTMQSIDVVADGDLILVVNDLLKVRVHSLVMRMTSPVFKAMLGPDWAEGQTQGTAASPKEIKLPEDDAEGMQKLCLVLHQANDQLPEEITVDQLFAFAVLVDKYDCRSAVRLTSRAWLSELQRTETISNMLLTAAYKLDDAIAFERLSDEMVRCEQAYLAWDVQQKRTSEGVSGDEGKVLDAVLAKIKIIDIALKMSIAACAEELSYYMMPQYDHYEDADPTDDESVHSDDQDGIKCSNYAAKLSQRLLRDLANAGIWPLRARKNMNFEDLMQAVKDFKVPRSESEGCDACWGWNINSEAESFVREMKKAVKKASDSTALCLDCVKRGGSPGEGEACRITHD